jgi:hypothetical protein
MFLGNPNIHYHFHKITSSSPVLSQLNLIQNLLPDHFNIVLYFHMYATGPTHHNILY